MSLNRQLNQNTEKKKTKKIILKNREEQKI